MQEANSINIDYGLRLARCMYPRTYRTGTENELRFQKGETWSRKSENVELLPLEDRPQCNNANKPSKEVPHTTKSVIIAAVPVERQTYST